MLYLTTAKGDFMILRFSNDKQKYTIITISAILIIAVVTFTVNKIIEIYTVHQVFAAYNMLTEAYQTSLKNEKYEWTKEKMNVNVLANKYIKYLPVKKDCAKRDNTCFAPYVRYKNKVGPIKLSRMEAFRKAELKNGMTVAVGIQHPACDGPRGRCGSVFVDINGKKGPNKFGSDVFDFGVYKNEIKPYKIEIVHVERCIEGNGQGCSSYILKYGRTNYKAYDKIVTREVNRQAQSK